MPTALKASTAESLAAAARAPRSQGASSPPARARTCVAAASASARRPISAPPHSVRLSPRNAPVGGGGARRALRGAFRRTPHCGADGVSRITVMLGTGRLSPGAAGATLRPPPPPPPPRRTIRSSISCACSCDHGAPPSPAAAAAGGRPGAARGAATSGARVRARACERSVGVVRPVPVQMWAGGAQSRCRCGRVSPVPVQMWQGAWYLPYVRRSICRGSHCGRF